MPNEERSRPASTIGDELVRRARSAPPLLEESSGLLLSPTFEQVDNRRAIIDRRATADALAAVPAGRDRNGFAVKVLREALEQGRSEIARRLTLEPDRGRAAARSTAYLHDQIVRLAYDFATDSLSGERAPQPMAIVGLGGTGRGEMAPFSDVDLMFLTRARPSKEQEQAVEAVLPLLWDLKLKVGHSIRSIAELLTLAKSDMTVRTAFLEARLVWGEQGIFDEAMKRFRAKIVAGTPRLAKIGRSSKLEA